MIEFTSIQQLHSSMVLVLMSAPWCGPCAKLKPIVQSFADLRKDISVGVVDIDANPSLAAAFNVRSVPTLLALRDGHIFARHTGPNISLQGIRELVG
jgi:thioredoxin 1